MVEFSSECSPSQAAQPMLVSRPAILNWSLLERHKASDAASRSLYVLHALDGDGKTVQRTDWTVLRSSDVQLLSACDGLLEEGLGQAVCELLGDGSPLTEL